jgi:hypothetical protein
MTRLHRWKSASAALMALTVTTSAVVPLFASAPASAQYVIGQSRTVTIPTGVSFPVSYEKEKIIVTPGETMKVTLKIPSNIVDRNRNVLIPEGTEIVGQLQPITNNSKKSVRYVAQELIFPSGERQYVNASSAVYSKTEKITKNSDTSQVLTDAAIGAGAASVISLLTGNRKLETIEPILGAGAGALASILLRKKEADVFVIRPERDLKITLRSNLVLATSRL